VLINLSLFLSLDKTKRNIKLNNKKNSRYKIIFRYKVKTKNNPFTMPQLLPFFFVNQMAFAFAGLFVLVYISSKYILPLFTELSVTRMYITKL
jgi:F-type H+-transporting ATPase subunit 8